MGTDETVEAILEEAAGPLTWHNSEDATAIVDGHRVEIRKKYARGGGPMHLSGAEFSYDMGGRPIYFDAHSVEHTSIPEKRRLRTGDPVFDREMAIEGWPEEVVIAALDEEARRYLPTAVVPRFPLVRVEDGRLRMAPSIFHARKRQVAGVEEIAGAIRFVAGTGSRLVSNYDARYDEIRRTQGDEAAEAWRGASRKKAAGNSARRLVPLVVVLAVAGAIAYASTQGWF